MRIIPIEGLNAIAWTFTVVDILLTIGRFRIHWRKNRCLGWDDYLNGLSLIFLLGFIITYQIYVPINYNAQLYALGLNDEPLTELDVIFSMKMDSANVILFFCVIYTVKASFLALYWRIFSVRSRFRPAWVILVVYTVLSFLVTLLSFFWLCGTPGKFMNIDACATRPYNLGVTFLTMWCVLNVVGDVLLMILPIAVLRTMLMEVPQKLGLALIFSLVLITIAFDILRTVYTLQLRPDFQDENAVWALLEPTIAVMVCALPCYRGYLSRPTSFAAFSSFLDSFTFSSMSSTKSGAKTETGDPHANSLNSDDPWRMEEMAGSAPIDARGH